MSQLFRYIVNSKILVVLISTIIFVGLFVFLKFFFVLFSDCHQLKVSTPSEKIVSSIRNNIGTEKDSTNYYINMDSIVKADNYYEQKESYNKPATKKDTTIKIIK